MAQQAARAKDSPPASAVDLGVARALDDLGRDWTVLKGCRLRPSDRGSCPDVLIHPVQGIAVLDVSPSETPDAAEAVRAKLDAARFDGIFAGHLPVVHLRLAPRRLPSLPALLDDAFAALPPLHLPGGDAWAGVAARALLAEHPSWPRVAAPPARGAAEDIERPESRTPPPRRRRQGRGLRKAAVVLVCLAALGGVLAAVRDLPALEASARAALAAAVKDLPALEASARAALAAVYDALPSSLPRPSDGQPPPEAVALPAAPAPLPDPAGAAPPSPAWTGGGATAPIPPSLSSQPEAPGTAAPVAVHPATPPQPRRPEPPPAQTRKPPERAAPTSPQQQQQQRRPPQQEAGAAPTPAAGDGAPVPEAASLRCRRVGARIGSGAPIGDADMRFFNEACIRW